MNRIAVFAHYDRDNLLDPYVIEYLGKLALVSAKIFFISTSQLADADIEVLKKQGIIPTLRANIGHDFGSWHDAISQLDLDKIDELIMCNDSVYGPFSDLDRIFNRMKTRNVDFWGLTDNEQYAYHLQSYFVVFRKRALQSVSFRRFWNTWSPQNTKRQVIIEQEIGLTQTLLSDGLECAAIFDWDTISKIKLACSIILGWFKLLVKKVVVFFPVDNMLGRRWHFQAREPFTVAQGERLNVTHQLWRSVLSKGIPFIKVELLRDNPTNTRISGALDYIHYLFPSYDLKLVRAHLARIKSSTNK